MMNTNMLILIVFAVYFSAIIGLAIHFRKSKNLTDYYLAGRGLNTWVGALSAQTSDMSGWLLMGFPGAIFAAGVGRTWLAIGLIIGTILNWIFVARRLRRYTIVANNSITLPSYFENRFRDKSHVLKIVAAIFVAVFFTVYVASSFRAGGILLYRLFGLTPIYGMMIVAALIVAYTFIGGLTAISWTDTIQGMMMLVALMALPIIAVSMMGGWSNVVTELPDGFYNILSDGAGGRIATTSIISDLAWGLGYFGMPHILIKLMAIKSDKMMKKSAVIGIVWVLLALGSALVVGLVGRAFLNSYVTEAGTRLIGVYPYGTGQETVFIEMVRNIFLHPAAGLGFIIIGGLLLCGIFAAVKSTADSQLLVASSAVTGDIYKQINKKATDKHLVWASRFVVLVIAVLALVFVMFNEDGVMLLVAAAWAGFGAAFGPLVLLSIFWKRTNRAGGIAGVITGGLTVLIWQYAPIIGGATPGASTGLFSIVPGFALGFIAIIIGSLVTKKPSDEILVDFETAKKPLIED